MVNPEINCNDCSSACCGKGQKFNLSPEETVFMQAGGSILSQDGFSEKEKLKGAYSISNRCGYVVEEKGQSRCAVYNDSRRPKVCREFRLGSAGCLYIREHGIPQTEAIVRKSTTQIFALGLKNLLMDPPKALGHLFAILNR